MTCEFKPRMSKRPLQTLGVRGRLLLLCWAEQVPPLLMDRQPCDVLERRSHTGAAVSFPYLLFQSSLGVGILTPCVQSILRCARKDNNGFRWEIQFSKICFWAPVRKEYLSIRRSVLCANLCSTRRRQKDRCSVGTGGTFSQFHTIQGTSFAVPGKGVSSTRVGWACTRQLSVWLCFVCLLQKILVMKITYTFPEKPGQCMALRSIPEALLKVFLISKLRNQTTLEVLAYCIAVYRTGFIQSF